ncbi:MAG: hypothetical protein WCA52_12935 [Candidatus Aquilonibacter sp.]
MRTRKCPLDARRAGGLARVRNGMQSLRAREGEDLGEKFGWEVGFIAAESNADNTLAGKRRCQPRRAHRGLRAEVARNVDDKGELDAAFARRTQFGDHQSNRGGKIELAMEEPPDRRRDEEFAVDNVLCQRIRDKLTR